MCESISHIIMPIPLQVYISSRIRIRNRFVIYRMHKYRSLTSYVQMSANAFVSSFIYLRGMNGDQKKGTAPVSSCMMMRMQCSRTI